MLKSMMQKGRYIWKIHFEKESVEAIYRGKIMKKVSIIIPVYNNEKYVEKCIRSVMEQTYKNLEIIVINDGSSDKSGEILEQLAEKEERIVLIHQENAGVAVARNRGLDLASGEYLTFIDGDDYVETDYIEKLYLRAEEQQSDMVICGLKYVTEDGTILKEIVPDEYQRMEREEWTFRISAVCAHFYRRELWEKYQIRFQSGERGEDMPISLFFSAVCGKISILPKSDYFYVQHPSSAMHNFRGLRKFRLPYQALENMLKKIQTIGIANSPEFYELFVLRILSTCLFDLARGAAKQDMKELCDYIVRILKMYFPGYYKNKKARLFSAVRVPFVQKAAVWILVMLVRTRLIYPVSKVLCCL